MPDVRRMPQPPLDALHPAALAAQARLTGRTPPPDGAFRYADLAPTAEGLLPVAAAHPASTFYAVGPLPSPLTEGLTALRLTNVHPVDHLPHALDFVVWHRGWSSHADPAPALRALQATLTPDGLAVIGWSVLPGWHRLDMLRTAALARAARQGLAPVAAARDLLSFLAASTDPTGLGGWFREAHATLVPLGDDHLTELLLPAEHHPRLVAEVLEVARDAGLEMLCEAERRTHSVARFPDHVVDLLLDERARFGPVHVEQYIDHLVDQTWRLTVFGHAGRTEAPTPLDGLWFSVPAADPDPPPALAALHRAAPSWCAFDDLRGDPPGDLVPTLLRAVDTDTVRVRTRVDQDHDAEARAIAYLAASTASPGGA